MTGDAGRTGRHGAPRWVDAEPRTPATPYPIRMFAEIGCHHALWGPIDEPPPTTVGQEEGEGSGDLEDVLPISEELRVALRAWAYDYFRWDGGDHSVPMDDHDERGFRLSRDLQRELGPGYAVTFSFTFPGPHRALLVAAALEDPLPGWSCRP